MSPQPPSRDADDLGTLGPEESRRFWDLIVQAGHHHSPMDFRFTLECQDPTSAQRVAAHCRAADYERVDVHKGDARPDNPAFWEVVVHTGVRPLDEQYFLRLREWIGDTAKRFECRFRSFTGSKGRAA
jgi:hypothetical protein